MSQQSTSNALTQPTTSSLCPYQSVTKKCGKAATVVFAAAMLSSIAYVSYKYVSKRFFKPTTVAKAEEQQPQESSSN